MAPLIGIPTRTRVTRSSACADEMRRAYAAAVAAAGGIPVLVPLVGEPAAVLDHLDGLLLSGGSDLDPAHYGEDHHPRLGELDGARDDHELILARAAIARDLPVFGVCRGHQVLVVAGGGSLWQDLPSQQPSGVAHDAEVEAIHEVTVVPGSRLAAVLGTTRLRTNSRHHQAAKTLGPGWNATATATDGVVEGIELPGRRFVLGVQWHPEDMQGEAPHRELFNALVAAARS